MYKSSLIILQFTPHLFKFKFIKNEFCKNCPDWSNTHWPHFKEKKRYGDLVEKLLG